MKSLAALVVGERNRIRLSWALRGIAEPHFLDRCDDLFVLASARRLDAALVEPFDSAQQSTLGIIQRLAAEFPSIPVLLYSTCEPAVAGALVAAGRAGAIGVIVSGVDDDRLALGSALRVASSGGRIGMAVSALAPIVPVELLPFVKYCLASAAHSPSVSAAARAIGLSRSALVGRLRAAGLPTPSEVISWCRLLAAAEVLADRGCSVERAAYEAGFPSASALGNMIRRYMGRSACALRSSPPYETVLEAFAAALRGRHPSPASRRNGRTAGARGPRFGSAQAAGLAYSRGGSDLLSPASAY